jgi:hypothetical protein
MKSMLICVAMLACSVSAAHAQSMTQREALEKAADLYESIGRYDLAEKARQSARELESTHELASDRVVRPSYESRAARPAQQPRQPSSSRGGGGYVIRAD